MSCVSFSLHAIISLARDVIVIIYSFHVNYLPSFGEFLILLLNLEILASSHFHVLFFSQRHVLTRWSLVRHKKHVKRSAKIRWQSCHIIKQKQISKPQPKLCHETWAWKVTYNYHEITPYISLLLYNYTRSNLFYSLSCKISLTPKKLWTFWRVQKIKIWAKL